MIYRTYLISRQVRYRSGDRQHMYICIKICFSKAGERRARARRGREMVVVVVVVLMVFRQPDGHRTHARDVYLLLVSSSSRLGRGLHVFPAQRYF